MPAHHSSSSSVAAERAATAASAAAPQQRSAHLSVNGVSKSFDGRRVLSDISFSASRGDRIGLVGENGTGKSTLLRILGADRREPRAEPPPGFEEADAGTVSHAGSVGSLLQELPYPDETPVRTVLDDAQRHAREALEAIERAAAALAENPADPALAQRYAEALERAGHAEAWTAEARRGEVLNGLGLGGIAHERAVGSLSGGQRLRLSLAALLLEAPHTILLDEPSNQLDDEAAAYLERVLTAWPGIVIVASHDRALLEAVTTKILDLDPIPLEARVLPDAQPGSAAVRAEGSGAQTDDPGSGIGIRVWGVGYSAARAARKAELARWRERYSAELAEREALTHEIETGSHEVNRKHESKSESRISRKFYADKDARVTSRRARNARVRLEQLERERVRRPPEPLRFTGIGAPDEQPSGTGPAPGRAAPDDPGLLRAESLAVRGRLAPTSLTVERGGRVLLTGPNGAGKSTLLASLAGELRADEGSLWVDPAARRGYLPQEVAFAQPERTAAEIYERALGAARAELRPLNASGLLAPRDIDRPVSRLSVGQRRRVALATLIADPPDILLLDEPTNHLSLALVEELEEALGGFAGALVIATHDRWFRSRWEHSVVRLAAQDAAPAM